MKKSSFFILIILGFATISCNKNGWFDQYKSVENNNWNYKNKIAFLVAVTDTISMQNIYINLRNNNEYSFENLNIVVEMYLANEKMIDSLQYQMTDNNGYFLGEGFSEIKENKLLYKEAFRFPNTGEYIMVIHHAMFGEKNKERIENLEGILNLGLRIEKLD